MTKEVRAAGLRTPVAIAVVVCLSSIINAASAANSWAAGCPNEQIRLEEAYAPRLPDCRAYEQVSPTKKNLADTRGGLNLVQVSPKGERVTFSSIIPFPEIVLGSVSFPEYLSTHLDVNLGDKSEWSTEGLEPPSAVGFGSAVYGRTENLDETIVFSSDQPPLAPGGQEEGGNYYIRDSNTGEYQLFVRGNASLAFADATPDGSSILFESPAALLPGVTEGSPNLYEWHEGELKLVAEDAVAGPRNYEGGEPGAKGRYYTENTLSLNGSRIFFTKLDNQEVYVYLPFDGNSLKISHSAAEWRNATPDGTFAFYTENEVLYRFNVEAAENGKEEVPEPVGSGVIGTLGVSNNGEYAYFANTDGGLLEWHEGTTAKLVANVSSLFDNSNWLGRCNCNGEKPGEGEKTARVTPDGQTMLFTTNLTLDRFEASTDKVTCVSCNPTRPFAGGAAYLTQEPPYVTASTPIVFLTRNLSEDGDRVFFETEAALVPEDINNHMDVYEWEREGAGSCTAGSGNGSGGCLYLISTGTSSAAESYFGDADAEGNNVFFFTRQSLVGQDQDYNSDLYDARVEGGIAAQNLPTAVPCTSEEACRGSLPSLPRIWHSGEP